MRVMRSDVQLQIFPPNHSFNRNDWYQAELQHVCYDGEQAVLRYAYSEEEATSTVGGICALLDFWIEAHKLENPGCFIYNPLVVRFEAARS